MVNAEVQKNDGESTLSLIRRFSRKVQGTGLIQSTRKRRYHSRTKSTAVRRKHTLEAIRRRENIMELIKLGKLTPMEPRGSRGPRKSA